MTSQGEGQMIAGCGFAMMAWELAQDRATPSGRALWYAGPEHIGARPQPSNSASGIYYRIIDSAWLGWQAAQGTMFHGDRIAGWRTYL